MALGRGRCRAGWPAFPMASSFLAGLALAAAAAAARGSRHAPQSFALLAAAAGEVRAMLSGGRGATWAFFLARNAQQESLLATMRLFWFWSLEEAFDRPMGGDCSPGAPPPATPQGDDVMDLDDLGGAETVGRPAAAEV